jgi:hypothetical protein
METEVLSRAVGANKEDSQPGVSPAPQLNTWVYTPPELDPGPPARTRARSSTSRTRPSRWDIPPTVRHTYVPAQLHTHISTPLVQGTGPLFAEDVEGNTDEESDDTSCDQIDSESYIPGEMKPKVDAILHKIENLYPTEQREDRLKRARKAIERSF